MKKFAELQGQEYYEYLVPDWHHTAHKKEIILKKIIHYILMNLTVSDVFLLKTII